MLVYCFLDETLERGLGHHDLKGQLLQNVMERHPYFPLESGLDLGLMGMGRWCFGCVVVVAAEMAMAEEDLAHLAGWDHLVHYFLMDQQLLVVAVVVASDVGASYAVAALASFPYEDSLDHPSEMKSIVEVDHLTYSKIPKYYECHELKFHD